jgi:hypothetical protein
MQLKHIHTTLFAEALHININKQLHYGNIRFHTEITVNTDMQHIQGNTHKHTGNYNHIYDKP